MHRDDRTAWLSVVPGGRDGEPPLPAVPRLVLPPDWLPIVLVAGDAVIAAAAVLGAYALRTLPFADRAAEARLYGPYVAAIPAVVGVCAFSLAVNRQYRSWRGASLVEQVLLLCSGLGLATLLLLALLAVTHTDEHDFSRLSILYGTVLAGAAMTVERVALRAWETRLRRRGIGAVRVLVVGACDTSELLIRRIAMFPPYGYAVCGVVDDRLEPGASFAGVPVAGAPADLARLVEALAIDRCILAMPGTRRDRLVALMRQCEAQRIPYQLVPDLLELLDTRARAESVDGVPMIGTPRRRVGSPAWAAKRLIDLTVAWWGLVLTAPLLLAIAAAVRLSSTDGPVLARQERVGRFRRPFTAYAFRTTASPLGRLLRRSRFDALPRLLNVLRGDMSLVGPRPQSVQADERGDREVPRHQERRQVRPGLTGWAQANDVDDAARAADRNAYDLYYIEHWSLGMDVQIIVRTVLRLLTGGAAGRLRQVGR